MIALNAAPWEFQEELIACGLNTNSADFTNASTTMLLGEMILAIAHLSDRWLQYSITESME